MLYVYFAQDFLILSANSEENVKGLEVIFFFAADLVAPFLEKKKEKKIYTFDST